MRRAEIYRYGERLKDVTSHPAFRNPAAMTARLYEAWHDPKRSAVLVTPNDTGSDGYTHRFFTMPRSVDDLIADQKAIAEWARMTYGWMGRSPDYTNDQIRPYLLFSQHPGGLIGQYRAFADACLAEYDLDGRTVPGLCSFEYLRDARGQSLNSSPSAAGIRRPPSGYPREGA